MRIFKKILGVICCSIAITGIILIPIIGHPAMISVPIVFGFLTFLCFFNRKKVKSDPEPVHVNNETKLCKYCQSEIPKKAKVCPDCKRSLNSSGSLVVAFFVFLFLICGGIISAFYLNRNMQKTVSNVSNESEYITMEEYNKIEMGMTYDQVKNIIGSDGEQISTVTTNDLTVTIFMWYGDGSVGSNANITFTNNSVTGKAQFGLNK